MNYKAFSRCRLSDWVGWWLHLRGCSWAHLPDTCLRLGLRGANINAIDLRVLFCLINSPLLLLSLIVIRSFNFLAIRAHPSHSKTILFLHLVRILLFLAINAWLFLHHHFSHGWDSILCMTTRIILLLRRLELLDINLLWVSCQLLWVVNAKGLSFMLVARLLLSHIFGTPCVRAARWWSFMTAPI